MPFIFCYRADREESRAVVGHMLGFHAMQLTDPFPPLANGLRGDPGVVDQYRRIKVKRPEMRIMLG